MSQQTERRRWLALGWLPGLGLASRLGAQTGAKRSVRISNPPAIMKPNGYSHVAEITSGKLAYIAGQVAAAKDGQLVGKDDFPAQVRQVFVNLNEAVKAAGGSFHDVVKLNY